LYQRIWLTNGTENGSRSQVWQSYEKQKCQERLSVMSHSSCFVTNGTGCQFR